MRAVVRKWGNSASVRIPASVMAAAGLVLDQAVEVREEDGRVVIEPVVDPVQLPEVDLDTLLAGITADNLHEAADFGGPVGREAF